ncbi:MAG: F0F1 ATP synthase subunit A [Thermodesulfobacteriota bacterium]
MDIKDITPDQVVFWEWGFAHLNLTIVVTWAVMALMILGAWLITRRLTSELPLSRWENLLEILVKGMENEIREVSRQSPRPYLPFVGTLFLFILLSNILNVVPGYTAPTASLSTTAALAICVFVAVPAYGIRSSGLAEYLKQYIRPTVIMLPFNIMGELSRTLALAVRLFGNLMSAGKIVAILLALTPFVFPVIMNALGLLTGVIQAYIFAILAMVYIASGTRARQERKKKQTTPDGEKGE